MSAKLHHRNSTMHITEDSRRNSSSGQYSGHSSSSATHTGTFTGFGSVSGAGGGPLFSKTDNILGEKNGIDFYVLVRLTEMWHE